MDTSKESTRELVILTALMIGNFLAMINNSTFNILLPSFMEVFATDLETVQWVIVAYMLASGLSAPIVGYLCDKYSARNLLISGFVLFGAISLLCTMARSIYLLILLRACQGIAGGFIMTGIITIAYQCLSKERQMIGMAMITLSSSIGVACGPSIAGGISHFWGWQGVFLLNLPLVVFSTWCVYKYVPAKHLAKPSSSDGLALGLVTLGTLALLYCASKGNQWGWGSGRFLVGFTTGILLLGLFIWRQIRHEAPILNMTVFKYAQFTYGLILNNCTLIALCLSPFLMAIYLQAVLHLNPLEAGSVLLLPTLCMGLVSPLIPRLSQKIPPRILLVVGLGMLSVGTYFLSRLGLDTSVAYITLWLSVRYGALGIITPLIQNHALSAVPVQLVSQASAMLNWIRQIVMTISLSVFTAILSMRNAYYNLQWADKTMSQCAAINDVTFYSLVIILICLPLTILIKQSNQSFGTKV